MECRLCLSALVGNTVCKTGTEKNQKTNIFFACLSGCNVDEMYRTLSYHRNVLISLIISFSKLENCCVFLTFRSEHPKPLLPGTEKSTVAFFRFCFCSCQLASIFFLPTTKRGEGDREEGRESESGERD